MGKIYRIQTVFFLVAFGTTFINLSATAQSLKSRSTERISVAVNQFFDFDLDENGDRSSADIRLVKGSRGDIFLEPLNGAGVGFLENDKNAYQTCAANIDSIRASRINLTSLRNETLICVRTSENRIGVFKFDKKASSSFDIESYSVWQRPSTLPPPPPDNRVLYGSQKPTNPGAVASQADPISLIFNVPVKLSNVLPGAAGFHVSCSVYHPNVSIAGIATTNHFSRGESESVALNDSMRREHSQSLYVSINFISDFDLSAVETYSCHLRLEKDALNSYSPKPQFPQTWSESSKYVVHRGEVDLTDLPWDTGAVPIDAAANRNQVIKTNLLQFNGLAIPVSGMGKAPIPGTEDPQPPDFGDVTAGLVTEVWECPAPDVVKDNTAFRTGHNEAGWDTYYQPGGENGSQKYTASEAFYLAHAELKNANRTFECRYQQLITHEFDYTQRLQSRHVEFAAEGFGLNISKIAPGACTPVNPAEWNENGVCVGEPADRYSPLCPPEENKFYSDGCMQAINTQCAVTCPNPYQPN